MKFVSSFEQISGVNSPCVLEIVRFWEFIPGPPFVYLSGCVLGGFGLCCCFIVLLFCWVVAGALFSLFLSSFFPPLSIYLSDFLSVHLVSE